jgi:GTP cyclohydrolase FolE2
VNRPDNPQTMFPIADVQSRSDHREIAIDQVGIKGLRYPLLFADQDGNGVVDFMEFVAFYTQALHDSRKSDLVHERRRKTQEQRARRRERALKYVQADALKTALAAGTLQLLSAQWLLARAGYASTVVERRGITKTKWSLKESPQPLPPFQVRGSSLMGSDDLVIASLIGRPSAGA